MRNSIRSSPQGVSVGVHFRQGGAPPTLTAWSSSTGCMIESLPETQDGTRRPTEEPPWSVTRGLAIPATAAAAAAALPAPVPAVHPRVPEREPTTPAISPLLRVVPLLAVPPL